MKRALRYILFVGLVVCALCTSVYAQTLTIWTFNDDHATFLREVGKQFEQLQPDVRIEVEVFPIFTMHDNLLIALTTGVGAPDIANIEVSHMGKYFRGDIQLVDLTERLDEYWDQINPAHLAPYSYAGNIYGLGHVAPAFMYYRFDVLDEVGIDPETIETWNDMLDVGEVLKETDRYALRLSAGAGADIGADFGQLWMMMQLNNAGFFDEEGNLTIDSPKAIDTLQFYVDLIYEYEIALSSTADFVQPSWHVPLQKGEVVFDPGGDWYVYILSGFAPDLEGKINVMKLPAFEDVGVRAASYGGHCYAITEFTDDVELAWEFLEFLQLNPEHTELYYSIMRGVNLLLYEALEHPVLDREDPFFAGQNIGPIYRQVAREMPPFYTAPLWWETVDQLVNTGIHSAVAQELTPEEALQRVAEFVRAAE